MKKYIDALAIFTGTAIGVGIFGLPYAAAAFGFWPTMAYLLALGAVTIVMQLIYGEICLRTINPHRMPGYAQLYLGPKAKALILASNSLGLYAAILAYLIIGGEFLANLLMPIFGGPEVAYLLIYFAAGAFLIYLGAATVANSTIVTLTIFISVLVLLFYHAIPKINLGHFSTFNPENFILPYGIILFSLSAITVIPDVREILSGQSKKLKSVIILGTLITIIFSALFIVLVTGVTGSHTTPDALTGLKTVLGNNILLAGFIFGVIVIFDSYLSIGLSLKKVFQYDLKFSHYHAWILAIFVPLLLYFLGVQNFIKIISVSAAITALIDGTIIYLIYLKAKTAGERQPEYNLPFTKALLWPLISLFVVGVIATILTLAK